MKPLGPMALPLSLLYGIGTKVFRKSFEAGFRERQVCRKPVLSVGNIEAGGTGKTPLVLSLCHWFLSRGRRPGIVSRGYGRKRSGHSRLVSKGEGLLLSPEEAGDEPALYATRFPDIPVAVSEDRREGVEMIQDLCDLILLDDGFQSLEIIPTLSFVFLPSFLAERPSAGLSDLLPSGPLREPVRVLDRATHWVMPSSGDPVNDMDQTEKVRRHLSGSVAPSGFRPILFQRYAIEGVDDFDRRRILGPKDLAGFKVALVVGIANPMRVLQSLRALGADVVGFLALPDHAQYTPMVWKKVAAFSTAMKEQGARLMLTTEKDRVKWSEAPSTDLSAGVLRGNTELLDPDRWGAVLSPFLSDAVRVR